MKCLTIAFVLLFSFPAGSLAGKKPEPTGITYRTELRGDAVDVYFQAMAEISRLKPGDEADLGDKLARESGARHVFFTKLGDETKLVMISDYPTEVKVEAALAALGNKFNWKFKKAD